jgi:hypothetical protein
VVGELEWVRDNSFDNKEYKIREEDFNGNI